MINGKRVLAIIPARGGSKRIPRKNLREIDGLPLFVHTILSAKGCGLIDKIIVSSDDEEILAIALENDCDIDKRSADLSGDEATTIEILKDLLNRQTGFDVLLTLQPTSPLRSSSHIVSALNFYIEKNADAVISVCKAEHPPHWINTLGDDFSMSGFVDSKVKNIRSQDLGDFYRLNGAIFCNNLKLVRESDSLLFENNAYAYIMPRYVSVDIDTIDDFDYAEYLLKKKRNGI